MPENLPPVPKDVDDRDTATALVIASVTRAIWDLRSIKPCSPRRQEFVDRLHSVNEDLCSEQVDLAEKRLEQLREGK